MYTYFRENLEKICFYTHICKFMLAKSAILLFERAASVAYFGVYFAVIVVKTMRAQSSLKVVPSLESTSVIPRAESSARIASAVAKSRFFFAAALSAIFVLI